MCLSEWGFCTENKGPNPMILAYIEPKLHLKLWTRVSEYRGRENGLVIYNKELRKWSFWA